MISRKNLTSVFAVLFLMICIVFMPSTPAYAAGNISATLSSDGLLKWSKVSGATQYWYSIDGAYRLAEGDYELNIKELIDAGVVPDMEGQDPLYKNTGSHSVSIEAYDDNGVIASWEGTYEYYSPAAPKVVVESPDTASSEVKGSISKTGKLTWEACKDAVSYSVGLNGVFLPVKEGEFSVSLPKQISDLAVIGELNNSGKYKVELMAIDAAGNPISTWEGSYTGDVRVKLSSKDTIISEIKDRKYTGKAIKPNVAITYQSLKLKKGTDYTVTYKNNKNVGTATVTIKGKGLYSGTLKKTFIINPKPTGIKKVTPGKKKFKVSWTKQKAQITGYQIQYDKIKTFDTDAKTITIKKKTTASKIVSKLKTGTYFVRIRTYKTVKGVKYYSSWSKAKKVKIK